MSHNGLHILITGGAGFIGSHLVEYHLNKGDKVHAVDDLTTGSRENVEPFLENPRFRFTEADIVTWEELAKAAAWADRIYHMAAVVGVHKVLSEPIKCLATNIAGCERILRAASAGGWKPQIVIPSTAEVYGHAYVTDEVDKRIEKAASSAEAGSSTGGGEPFPGFREDAELRVGSTAVRRWNYPISKIANEALGLSYGHAFNMPVTIVRFFNTVGPRQTGRYGMVVPTFVEQAVAGKPITVYGDGKQTRSFCDVRDSVVFTDLLAGCPACAGEIVNVGNDREISIRQLAEMVKERAQSSSPIVHIPYREAYGEGYVDTFRRKPDLSKLRRLTNYEHKWRLEDTIDDLIERARRRGGKR